jgi:outer membrane usher protein
VNVSIEGEELQWIKRESLIEVLRPHLKDDTIRSLERLSAEIRLEQIPFPVSFDVTELKIQSTIDLELRSLEKTDLGIDYEDEKANALRPAPVGGAINYRLEQNYGSEAYGGNYFSGQFNSFVNVKGFVFENSSYYQSHLEPLWFRGDTRIVKDFEKSMIRTQVGDVYPTIQGFMVARPLGGVNIARNFSLNPYRLPYPTGNQNFTIKARSLVKYFLNSVLVKSEYLPPGNYSAKDIPLNNGLNTIVIEATDDLGQTQVFTFRASSSINLLNEGESRFDLSYGTPFIDSVTRRQYTERDGKLFSGYFQYGFSSFFSSSVYLQNQAQFNLMGSELIYASEFGNLSAGGARSTIGNLEGQAIGLGYQLITQNRKWFNSHTIGLRFENRSERFRTSLLDSLGTVKNNYAANYSLPLTNLLSLAVGGNYGDVRDNSLEDRYGTDVSLNFRLFQRHNLSLYVSRQRDEFKNWNDVAYAFVTITLPDSNSFVSGLYDQQQKSGRITAIKDNQNRLYSPRIQAIAQSGENNKNGEFDINYPTPIGELGARYTGQEGINTDKFESRGSVRVNSAFVFAYQEGELGLGMSRPVPGSFVIFKPEPRLRDQKVGLKSTSPYTESESGLFKEIVFTNLIAYQYRDVQLDPTFLDPGRSLVREKFVLYPTYRSAHLLTLEERGSVVLTGRLVNADGTPIALQVGHMGPVTFFTNRDGLIFIEGAEAGHYELTIEGRDDKMTIDINGEERGLKDVGTLRFEETL